MRMIKGLAVLAFGLTLAACGGGGGNAGTPPFGSGGSGAGAGAGAGTGTTDSTAVSIGLSVLNRNVLCHCRQQNCSNGHENSASSPSHMPAPVESLGSSSSSGWYGFGRLIF